MLHLWCYVGWLMGVDRRWLPFDERAGLRMMYQIARASPQPTKQLRAGRLPLGPAAAHPLPPVPAAAPPLPVRAGPVAGHHAAGPAGVRALRVPARPHWYPLARLAVERPQTSCARPLPGGPAVGAAARR
ncbi:DUF2236 domain-containing protein, partial [Rhodococcus hoagii]|nr:DUF2236 domain-containing protein [Prescottella equi]